MPLARGFGHRILILAAVLGGEALAASIFLDGVMLAGKPGVLTALLHDWGAWIFRGGIGFIALFATFAWMKYKTAVIGLSVRAARAPIQWAFLAAHLAAVAMFAALSAGLYGSWRLSQPSDMIVPAWGLAAVATVVSAALAIVPWALWSELLRVTGKLWLYAAAAAVAACILGAYSRELWAPTARLTFNLVTLLLKPIFHNMVVQPAILRLGTHNFTARVSEECSGLEGIGLLLIFSTLWMVLFREETRFPQALLLLPAGIVTLYLLNVVRIAALIVIGNAGAKEIATRGFHSQAGWIAFNGVAFGFSLAARRLPWFSRSALRSTAPAVPTYNPAAAYLVPFLAILAARMVSRAATGNFEWLYPLGFVAAGAALIAMRRRYEDLSWRIGWLAPLSGALVFLLWLALDLFPTPAVNAGMPPALAAAPWALRDGWLALRVLSAVITVPAAEELAFRGFLLRRLISSHFETIPFRQWTWLALLGSSLAFGAMHGGRWLAGTVAGAIYATVAIRSGRLTDSVVAHATTNGLLAAYVLLLQKWQFW